MGRLEITKLRYMLSDGRLLFDKVSFQLSDGAKTGLIGANGIGKTTLLSIIAGDLLASGGQVTYAGGLGVMRQFIGSIRDDTDVHAFLLGLCAPEVIAAGAHLQMAQDVLSRRDDESAQMSYAEALVGWGDAGGYDAEVLWDTCTIAALGMRYEDCQHRRLTALSGGEQKRLALEALLRGPAAVLLLDEPDNYLDVSSKCWLEAALLESPKTVLFVSHDRELLARAAGRIVTIEAHGAWVHGGGFLSYHKARQARRERLDERHRRWNEEHERLRQLVFKLREQAKISAAMASKLAATETRLKRFEAAGPPPEQVTDQKVTMRLRGGRTGVRAVMCESLELAGLTESFDIEVYYGERLAVLGSNGTGKSHFLRLLAGETVEHTGVARLGARVKPGWFSQTHERPELFGKALVEVLHCGDGDRTGLDRGRAISALRRYELQMENDQAFDQLSGGQQARFQILLLELSGCTLLVLDEPTDNLDLASAEALEDGLREFAGTVVAVTHDRWFARAFDRFLIFGADKHVYESAEAVWDKNPGRRS